MTRDNLSLWSIQIPKKFMHINFADLNISVLQNTSVRLTYIIMSLVLSAFKYSLLTTGQSNGDIIMLNRPQNELFPHQQLIIEFMHTSNIINVKNLMHKWYLWSSIKIILYHLFISERRGVRDWTRGNPFPSPSPLSSLPFLHQWHRNRFQQQSLTFMFCKHESMKWQITSRMRWYQMLFKNSGKMVSAVDEYSTYSIHTHS